MTRTISAALIAALLTLSAGPAAAALSVPRLPGEAEAVPGELIVKFKPGVAATGRDASLAAAGHSTISTMGALGAEGWALVRVAPGQTDAQALAAYAGDPRVEFAEPNYIYRASRAPPGARFYGQQWGWKNSGQTVGTTHTQPTGSPVDYTIHNPGTTGSDMNLEKAWDQITDCSSVVVAVVDTGVNYTHVDLAANMWNGGGSSPRHGYNFADATPTDDPMDLNGHGTHVAGTIGATGAGVTGVCWKATIMAVRVLGADGSGALSGIIQGIDYAVTNHAKVINMSLGGPGFSAVYNSAIERAQAADVLVVVAAGNDGTNNEATPVYPCNFANPNLICVAALDQAFGLADFSNFGATSVDVGAPGTNIVSTYTGPKFDDPLDSTTIPSWSFSTSTAGGGWSTSNPTITPNMLVVPANFDTSTPGSYKNNTDDRAWRTYTQAGLRLGSMSFGVVFDIANGDHFRSAWSSTGSDPFGPGGHVVSDDTNVKTFPYFSNMSIDFSGCGGATCTFGVQFQSDVNAQTSAGLGVGLVSLGTVRTPGTDYNTENGTSMASPAVAGLATMLRAWHGPAFTAADVIGAIKGGGRPNAALAGKTTSGKSADAMGALAFINPPSGVTATVR